MEDPTDRAPNMDSFDLYDHVDTTVLWATYLVLDFEYAGHLCVDIYTHLVDRGRGKQRQGETNKQTNTVELFILMYNSRSGKQNTEGLGGYVIF